MVTIKEVALRAGVSIATVSRVLSHPAKVSPALREKVLGVIEDVGYRPNRTASSLRTRRSRAIGVLVSDIRNPFFTAITRAIEDLASARQMSVYLCNTDEDAGKERLYLDTLLDENVAGIILSPTQDSAAAYKTLFESETPVVLVDRRVEGAMVDGVLCDNVQSAYMLTSHLLESGYRRIAAVLGLQNSTTGRERLQGYRLALTDHNLKFDAGLVSFVPPRETEAEDAIMHLLKARQPPDAILTGNSRLTIGALNACQAAGVSVPEDVGLCGFDETMWTPHVAGGITVISQPTHEIGATAGGLLFQNILAPSRTTREVILKGTLIVRESTRRRA